LRRERFTDSLDRFEMLARSGELAELAAAIGEGEQWHDDLDGLSTAFDEWLSNDRAHRHEALMQLVLHTSEAGFIRDLPGGRALVQRLHDIDPLDERVARLGMQLDVACGDVAGLERRFQQLCAILASELGVEPSVESCEIHRQCREKLHREPARQLAQVDDPTPISQLVATQLHKARRSFIATTSVIFFLPLFLSASTRSPGTALRAEDSPSITVLPFRNSSMGDSYLRRASRKRQLGCPWRIPS
jgi:DNA-binding SARP family transcriptional activator